MCQIALLIQSFLLRYAKFYSFLIFVCLHATFKLILLQINFDEKNKALPYALKNNQPMRFPTLNDFQQRQLFVTRLFANSCTFLSVF